MENMFSFEKLEVYQMARKYVAAIYKITDSFPNKERYSLCDQLNRAAVSVTSNIAEGTSRTSSKEKIHFLEIAYGSLLETYSQLQNAIDVGYFTEKKLEELKPLIQEIANKLTGLRRSLLKGGGKA